VSLLIVGCGYVGKALAENYCRDGRVYALTRTEQSADQLRTLGVEPLVGHWLQFDSLPEFPADVSKVVVAVPHRDDAQARLPEGSDQHHVLGLSNLLAWMSPRQSPPRLVYLSTTGVFGATQSGEAVDEQSPISPTRIGPRIAAAAESWLSNHRNAWRSTVLRLAGIYGAGRIPLLATLQQGQSLAVVKDGMLNLIHLDDIVQAIQWALQSPEADDLYLVSDNQPVRRELFYKYLAELQRLPPPQFAGPDPDSPRAARATDKIINSNKFWSHSGLQPRMPSYCEGLAAILPGERS
jgi:nucleoside-diphosphate-sugar epimerase